MTIAPSDTRAIVLDIEGTTTRAAFVYEVLFPFARAHALDYLAREGGSDACRAAVTLLRGEQAADRARGEQLPPDLVPSTDPASPKSPGDSGSVAIAPYVDWLMDRDRKSPGLKALQGLIWQEGYRTGELRGEVYGDVVPALERWRARGVRAYIYSSGSVLAQRLLFQSTQAGDLTAWLAGYFDTAVGPKTAVDSYRAILKEIGVSPSEALFVSDTAAELDAAKAAGLWTALCERQGAASGPPAAHPIIHTFDELA